MSYPKLSLSDLRKIVWMFADTIRDKGRGNSSDYMPIVIGVLLLKRIMDMRAEFKRRYLEGGDLHGLFELNDYDIDQTIAADQDRVEAFQVSEEFLHTYRLEWHDIASFPANDTGEQVSIPYHDGLGGNLLTTSAANKFVLLKECLDAFHHERIHEIFATFNFMPKVFNPNDKENVLDPHDFEVLIEELNAYSFGLEFADEDIFANVYMDLVGRFAAEGGKRGGEFYTPTMVVRNAIRFLNLKPVERKIVVADLASGACTFMVEFANAYKAAAKGTKVERSFNDLVEFVTGEKDRTPHALGDANMLLHGYSNIHTSIHANSMTEYDTELGAHCRQGVDFLLANPPYGLKDYGHDMAMSQKNMPRWAFGVPNKGDGEYAFLLTALDLLNDEGRAVIVMPMGTLFRDSTADIRKRILDKDWIEGIVELPKGMFQTTSIPVCLWIINKRKEAKDQDRVVIVDASSDFTKVGKINEWNADKSVNAFITREEIEGYSRLVPLSEVAEGKYNLSVSRYVRNETEEEKIDIGSLIVESQALLKAAQTDLNEICGLINSANRIVDFSEPVGSYE